MQMARILLVEDDQPLVALYAQWLAGVGCEVIQAATGGAALQCLASLAIDGAVIELVLPDMSGLRILEALRAAEVGCIVVTGNGSCRAAVSAMRLGALDFLEKPIDSDAFMGAVNQLMGLSTNRVRFDIPIVVPCAHSLRRWTVPIIRMLDAPEDPRTLSEWARTVGMSTGAIRNWCRTARISARRSLLFARVLRAVLRRPSATDAPEQLLNIVDRRTLAKVLMSSGAEGCALPRDVDTYFARQQFVDNPFAIAEVRHEMFRQFGERVPKLTLPSLTTRPQPPSAAGPDFTTDARNCAPEVSVESIVPSGAIS